MIQQRSSGDWKASLLTLPDGPYFDLMRSVFGNIKTPFSKQKLVEDLSMFLSREEIRKTIAAYIDETDAKLIAAITLLDEPTFGTLERFFAGDLSYGALHGVLVNLEERFIVYRFQDEGHRRLALNPVLEPVLEPVALNTRCLFSSRALTDAGDTAVSDGNAVVPVKSATVSGKQSLDDRTFAAFFAFVLEEPEFFKAEGGQSSVIRKKSLERGRRLFPELDIPSFIGAMQWLGLLKTESEGMRLCPDKRRLSAFQELSRPERLAYCAAAFYMFRQGVPDDALSYLHRTELRARAVYIHRLFKLLAHDRQYPLVSLKRFALLLEWDEGDFGNDVSSLKWDFDSLLAVMETTGLLEPTVQGWWKSGITTAEAADSSSESSVTQPAAQPVLVMDTAFSFVLCPEISLRDALALASFSTVLATGAAPRFELTRQSVVRGFDSGQSASSILAFFDRLSQHKIDSNLEWTLRDWEKRYTEVSLDEGVVLTLAEAHRYLAENGPLASLVWRTLAPGVYLLSASTRNDVAEILRKAGVDIIAQRCPVDSTVSATGALYPPVGRGERVSDTVAQKVSDTTQPSVPDTASSKVSDTMSPDTTQPSVPDIVPPKVSDTASAACKARFRAALEKLAISREARDALAARIERRLILSESQLSETAIRYEKLEARGLDYAGKITLAKQAISAKSFIEVFCPASAGNIPEGGLLGIPEGLEKQGTESILVVRPCENTSDKNQAGLIRLPLGKISLLRRIKSSIFEE